VPDEPVDHGGGGDDVVTEYLAPRGRTAGWR
jgi:hypothetical protein